MNFAPFKACHSQSSAFDISKDRISLRYFRPLATNTYVAERSLTIPLDSSYLQEKASGVIPFIQRCKASKGIN
jgi:hypothetical protein